MVSAGEGVFGVGGGVWNGGGDILFEGKEDGQLSGVGCLAEREKVSTARMNSGDLPQL